MKRFAEFRLAGFALAALAGAGQASAADISLELRADVAPFCRIWTESDAGPVQFDGDRAQLGSVREVCNMSNGYVVRAAFSNITEGSILAGSETAPVASDGTASFSYGEARLQQRDWQLVGAKRATAEAPVFLRLSISPL